MCLVLWRPDDWFTCMSSYPFCSLCLGAIPNKLQERKKSGPVETGLNLPTSNMIKALINLPTLSMITLECTQINVQLQMILLKVIISYLQVKTVYL